jgi:lipopolysaccharide/colanic/teichoic acid biosynthesis glycosyltransferase
MDYKVLKRIVDIGVSATALMLLSPLLVVIPIAIRFSSVGPALYRSSRVGLGGITFEMLKFRTMKMNAPDLRNPDGSTYSGPNDLRVTPLGRWLRRTSLDELPQLWNVLRGDMSLVGPRPDLPDQVGYYSPEDRQRLTVRPGLTGLAQVNGRNAVTWKDRRALDVRYTVSMSFGKDLAILGRTIPLVIGRRGIFGIRNEPTRHGPPEN